MCDRKSGVSHNAGQGCRLQASSGALGLLLLSHKASDAWTWFSRCTQWKTGYLNPKKAHKADISIKLWILHLEYLQMFRKKKYTINNNILLYSGELAFLVRGWFSESKLLYVRGDPHTYYLTQIVSLSGCLQIKTWHINMQHKLCFPTFTTGGTALCDASHFPVVLSLASGRLYDRYLVVGETSRVPPSSCCVDVFLACVAVMVVSPLASHSVL